jgi:hypothetical protein
MSYWYASVHLTRGGVLHFRFEAALTSWALAAVGLPWLGPSARRTVATNEFTASPLWQMVVDLPSSLARRAQSAPTNRSTESADSSRRETHACAFAWSQARIRCGRSSFIPWLNCLRSGHHWADFCRPSSKSYVHN